MVDNRLDFSISQAVTLLKQANASGVWGGTSSLFSGANQDLDKLVTNRKSWQKIVGKRILPGQLERMSTLCDLPVRLSV